MISRLRLPFLALLLAGCSADGVPQLPEPNDAEDAPQTACASRFDPANTGTLSGRVLWTDPLPVVGPISFITQCENGQGLEVRAAPNPNRPQIDEKSRAVANAVVYLRKINPDAASPKRFEPLTVEIGESGIRIRQGNRTGRVGFVRLGDSAELISIEPRFHILRARGDDFFSITLPSPNDSVKRTLTKPGRIEFSSGTGLTWMRADVFVTEHPYYTLTDADGAFTLDSVPPGPAELVVYLPNWQAGTPIREPESTIIARRTYAPPFVRIAPIVVEKSRTTSVQTSLP